MAYTKTTLISRPVPSNGIEEALGDVVSFLKGGASAALDFFGSGIKAQGAAEALAQQAKADSEARAAAAAKAGGGIPTTYLVAGGLALAGVLVLAMRKK